MCGPGGSSSAAKKAARDARREEIARTQRIDQGRNNIDFAFSGFDNDYFRKYRGDFQNYYLPQLADQYSEANKQTGYGLARTKNLDSSAGAQTRGRIQQRYLDARTDIADKALGAVNDLRGRIEDTKSNLYAYNASAADPGQAVARSTALVGNLQQPASRQPLGDVFASLLNSGAQSVAAERQGYRGTGTGWFAPPEPLPSYYNGYNGSSYIVR